MPEESRIKLSPVDGGDPFLVPLGKVTIGRGTFLQITDKRVSRNHATLEIDAQGKLVIVPIHSNPCFYKTHGAGAQTMLVKDQPKVLEHGDVVALLPDKLAYRIVYLDHEDSLNEKSSEGNDVDAKENLSNDEKESQPVKGAKNEASKSKHDKGGSKTETAEGQSEGTRVLPDWMVGAGERTGVDLQSKLTKTKPPAKPKASPVKAAPKPKPTRPAKPVKKQAVSDDDDDDDDFKEDADDDDDDDDDYEEEKSVVKKRTKKSPGRPAKGRRSRASDDEDSSPKRRPRAVSLKKPKYTDDDFVISDEEMEVRDVSSEEESNPYGRRKNEDSDFVLDEDDSGSDWETSKKTGTPRGGGRSKSGSQSSKKVATPTSSKGRGRGRTSSARGGKSKRAKRHSDDDDFSDDDGDNYVPRVSKRRAAVAAVSRMKESSDYDDDYLDDEPAMKKKKTTPRGGGSARGAGRKLGRPKKQAIEDESFSGEESSESPRKASRPKKQAVEEDNDSEEENENEDEGKATEKNNGSKTKQVCQYGKDCYRKNPKHLEDFSHPEAQDNEDVDDGDDSNGEDHVVKKKNSAQAPPSGGHQKRAAALKQKEKFEAMHKAGRSDGESEEDVADGSDEDDANDSDFDVDSDSPVKSKAKSAAKVRQ